MIFLEDNKFIMQFFDNKTFDIIKNYDIRKLLPINFINYTHNKSIILCGNGSEGYIENESNKFIDSHDIVIRMNTFELIPEITGTKTDVHFTGSTISTNGINPYEKNSSISSFILQTKSKSFESRFKKFIKKKNQLLNLMIMK